MLTAQLKALVANYLIEDQANYQVAITGKAKNIVRLSFGRSVIKFSYNSTFNGKFNLAVFHSRVKNTINFIDDYKQGTLENGRRLSIAAGRDVNLYWTHDHLFVNARGLHFDLPQTIIPVIIKIASYVDSSKLLEQHSEQDVISCYMASIKQLSDDLINGKFV